MRLLAITELAFKLLILPTLAGFAPTAAAISFNCAQAVTRIETTICNNEELAKLDSELMTAYRKALLTENRANIKAEQAHWLKAKRNLCSDIPCLKKSYQERLATLRETTTTTILQAIPNSVHPGTLKAEKVVATPLKIEPIQVLPLDTIPEQPAPEPEASNENGWQGLKAKVLTSLKRWLLLE